MEDLPAELTIDILPRLPVKTVIHCKLVCKKWRNLVSDSSFVNLHLSRSPIGLIIRDNRHINIYRAYNNPWILKWVEIEDKVDDHHLIYDHLLSLNLAPILQTTRMVGSVNGLICLGQYTYKVKDTYICNPITREYMILPRQHFLSESFMEVGYGFGVSSLTGEYKVVRVFQARAYVRVLEAEVYTLGTCQWRNLGSVPFWPNAFPQFYGPFLNDHCHWIVNDNWDAPEKICAFDLNKETFRLFPSSPPHEYVRGSWSGCHSLGILKGCLCKLDSYNFELTVWVMKEYGMNNSWHKQVVITREVSVNLKWPYFEPIRVIDGLKDGSILMTFENKLCVFDPRSETIEVSEVFDTNFRGLAYRPSFLKLQNFESERVHMF